MQSKVLWRGGRFVNFQMQIEINDINYISSNLLKFGELKNSQIFNMLQSYQKFLNCNFLPSSCIWDWQETHNLTARRRRTAHRRHNYIASAGSNRGLELSINCPLQVQCLVSLLNSRLYGRLHPSLRCCNAGIRRPSLSSSAGRHSSWPTFSSVFITLRQSCFPLN